MEQGQARLGDPSLILTVPGGYPSAARGAACRREEFVARGGGPEARSWPPATPRRWRCANFREALDRGRSAARRDAYADWAQDYRRTLARVHLEALEGAAAAALAAAPGEAVAAAEQAVILEPLREASQLLLVEALAASGDQAAALGALAAFRERLAAELGLDPSPQALELERHPPRQPIRPGQSRPVAHPSRPPAAPARRSPGEIAFRGATARAGPHPGGARRSGPAVRGRDRPSGSGKSRRWPRGRASPLPVWRPGLPAGAEETGLGPTCSGAAVARREAPKAVPDLAPRRWRTSAGAGQLRPVGGRPIDPESRRPTLQGASGWPRRR